MTKARKTSKNGIFFTLKKKGEWVLTGIILVGFITMLAVQLFKEDDLVKTAPQYSVQLIDGITLTAEDLEGQLVVLNFWATWCDPCADEMPYFQEAWGMVSLDEDVRIIAVAVDDSRYNVERFIGENGIGFEIGFDPDEILYRDFQVNGFPVTYFINSQGKIVYQKIGPFSSSDDIIESIEKFR